MVIGWDDAGLTATGCWPLPPKKTCGQHRHASRPSCQ